MAQIERSAATLRIFGDSPIPDEISKLLGCLPSAATKKGEVIQHPSGREHIAKHGSWRLQSPDCKPENLDHQVSWLLGKLTDNLDTWCALNREFRVDLFCGLFMSSSNDGLSLSPATLVALGSRRIEIGFDIYDPSWS
ncbi:MAG TPA: DUF4279 domain-containing protein [Moraxellaceae bacterium]